MKHQVATVDADGKIVFPEELRLTLQLEPGEEFLIQFHPDPAIIGMVRINQIISEMRDQALADLAAGETINLRDFAAEMGIDLDQPLSDDDEISDSPPH